MKNPFSNSADKVAMESLGFSEGEIVNDEEDGQNKSLTSDMTNAGNQNNSTVSVFKHRLSRRKTKRSTKTNYSTLNFTESESGDSF